MVNNSDNFAGNICWMSIHESTFPSGVIFKSPSLLGAVVDLVGLPLLLHINKNLLANHVPHFHW